MQYSKINIGLVLMTALLLPAGVHANTFDVELVAKARSMLYGTSISAERKRLENRTVVEAKTSTKSTEKMISSRTIADIPADGSVRGSVLRYFKDAPEMAAIAECESGMRQFGPSGSVLRGGTGGMMIGLFQLHESYHRSAAASLGLNIDSLAGNMAYAKHLYELQGAGPWLSSADCWQPKLSSIKTEANSSSESSSEVSYARFSKTLTYGAVDEEVRLLQKTLNQNGYAVAESGPGAPGEETSIFGPLTRAALTKFQCEEDIACAGDREYGMVGEDTRDVLNKLADD